MTPVLRYLAHRVVHEGRIAGLSVVEAREEGISVQPFDGETASTAFVDGTLIIEGGEIHRTPLLIASLPLPAEMTKTRLWPQD